MIMDESRLADLKCLWEAASLSEAIIKRHAEALIMLKIPHQENTARGVLHYSRDALGGVYADMAALDLDPSDPTALDNLNEFPALIRQKGELLDSIDALRDDIVLGSCSIRQDSGTNYELLAAASEDLRSIFLAMADLIEGKKVDVDGLLKRTEKLRDSKLTRELTQLHGIYNDLRLKIEELAPQLGKILPDASSFLGQGLAFDIQNFGSGDFIRQDTARAALREVVHLIRTEVLEPAPDSGLTASPIELLRQHLGSFSAVECNSGTYRSLLKATDDMNAVVSAIADVIDGEDVNVARIVRSVRETPKIQGLG